MDHDLVAKLVDQLSTLVTLIALAFGVVLANAVLTMLNGWLSRNAAKVLGVKIDAHTKLAFESRVDLSEKMDSAARAVKHDAAEAVKAAKSESNKVLEQIEDKLNGGPGGLNELSARVVKLEGGQEILAKGQTEITKAVDRLTAAFNQAKKG